MKARTVAIVSLLGGVAVAVPFGLRAAAPAGQGALGGYLNGDDAPDIYMELFDLNTLEGDLRSSGIGRLGKLFVPALEQHLGADVFEGLDEHLGLDPMAVLQGDVSWENALAGALITLADEHLGLERDDAIRAAAAFGARFSWAVDVGGERAAASWSLRSGGDDVLLDLVVEQFGRLSKGTLGAVQGRLLLDAHDRGGGRLFGLVVDGDEEVFVALRPDLIAVSSDVEWGRALASAPGEVDAGSDFSQARERALHSGAPLWGWIDGELGREFAADADDRAALAALGLDGVRSAELTLAGEGGQLTSRLRIELAGRGRPGPGDTGLFSLVRGGRASWEGLDRLTADTMLVAGFSRAPADVAREVIDLISRLPDPPEVQEFWAQVSVTPLLRELMASGATGDEAVFFLRSGAAGLPMGYVVMPAGEDVLERLGRLEDGAQGPGGKVSLRVKELDGRTCWFLSSGGIGLALTHQDGALIASQSFLALQDYLRQRVREDAQDRAELVAGVRAALRRSEEAAGRSGGNLAGFAHVRIEPLCEAAWPWLMLGISMSGAEGLEDLPDAFEIAEQIGDTTLLLFDDGDAIELHGRGLFGGLGVLF